MGFSKPSISHAVSVLRDDGFLTMDEDGFLHLTDISQEMAKKIYERHQFFTEQLIAAGVTVKRRNRTPAGWSMSSARSPSSI